LGLETFQNLQKKSSKRVRTSGFLQVKKGTPLKSPDHRSGKEPERQHEEGETAKERPYWGDKIALPAGELKKTSPTAIRAAGRLRKEKKKLNREIKEMKEGLEICSE